MLLEDGWTELRLARDWSAESLRWYQRHLSVFFTYCKTQGVTTVEGVTAGLVRRYIETRRAGISSHTLHGIVRAIRCFLNFLISEDVITDTRLTKKIALPVKQAYVIETFKPDMLSRLLKEAGKTHRPLRDVAILTTLIETGLRREELCTLAMDRVHLDEEDSYILVSGKGRRDRRIPLSKKAALALARYIHRERASDSPYVFVARNGAGIRGEGVERLLQRLKRDAGAQHFATVRVSCHTFRHSYATAFIAAGGDIYRLSRILGHADVGTTSLYLKTYQEQTAHAFSVLDTVKPGR